MSYLLLAINMSCFCDWKGNWNWDEGVPGSKNVSFIPWLLNVKLFNIQRSYLLIKGFTAKNSRKNQDTLKEVPGVLFYILVMTD